MKSSAPEATSTKPVSGPFNFADPIVDGLPNVPDRKFSGFITGMDKMEILRRFYPETRSRSVSSCSGTSSPRSRSPSPSRGVPANYDATKLSMLDLVQEPTDAKTLRKFGIRAVKRNPRPGQHPVQNEEEEMKEPSRSRSYSNSMSGSVMIGGVPIDEMQFVDDYNFEKDDNPAPRMVDDFNFEQGEGISPEFDGVDTAVDATEIIKFFKIGYKARKNNFEGQDPSDKELFLMAKQFLFDKVAEYMKKFEIEKDQFDGALSMTIESLDQQIADFKKTCVEKELDEVDFMWPELRKTFGDF